MCISAYLKYAYNIVKYYYPLCSIWSCPIMKHPNICKCSPGKTKKNVKTEKNTTSLWATKILKVWNIL